MKKILLVEDDEALGYLLREYLQMNDFDIHWSKNGAEGLKAFEEKEFQLALVDVMLPVMDGLTLLSKMKNANSNFPVILLTAKSLKVDKLKGFYSGADDYIVKPVEEEELVARIKAVLRRFVKPTEDTPCIFKIGTYEFQYEKRCLKKGDEEKTLSGREADLLKVLCLHQGSLIESSVILKNLWGKNDYFNKKSMDVFIYKLRNHLKDDAAVKIITVHNKGYILKTAEGG